MRENTQHYFITKLEFCHEFTGFSGKSREPVG